jgi:NADH:ubiquinone oxidoreductase subunit 6 (subunit J)
MRIVFTSLMAFFLSAFAGGMVAQMLAVWTNANEDYILVFMATVLVVMAVTLVFFVAQFSGNAARAVNWAAIVLLLLLAVMLLGLLGWTFSQPPAQRALKSDLAIIGGLMLPNVTVIVVHWLFVRWRLGHRVEEPRFGRGTQPL